MFPRPLAPALVLLAMAIPAVAVDLAPAHRAADRAADAVVLVEYVLEKEGRPFGGVGQRAELAAVGTIVSSDGLVVLPDAIFPESEDEQREPATPRGFLVRLRDGRRVKATLLGRDRKAALTFLQLETPEPKTPWPHVTFADVLPAAGDPVLLIELLPERYGYAPVTRVATVGGVVSKPRTLVDVDAHVQDSGTGTPVLDGTGRAIGLMSIDPIGRDPGTLQAPLRILGVLSRQKAPGFPMVIPSRGLLPLIASPPREALASARDKSWLGVTIQPVPRALADHLGIPAPTGVMVTSVRDGSPAAAIGMRLHDVIRELDGKPIEAVDEAALAGFIERVQALGTGRAVPVTIWRDGSDQRAEVTLATAPPTAVVAREHRDETLGLAAQDLTYDLLLARGLPEDLGGVIVSDLEIAGQAQVGGLEPGDIIQGANRTAVRDVDDLRAALDAARQAGVAEIIFFVLRDPDTLFIPVKTTW